MDVNDLLNTVKIKEKSRPEIAKEPDASFDNVMNSISQNWKESPDKELNNLKKELDSARNEIEKLKKERVTFSKNENKILAAIRSEALKQETDTPQISSRDFRATYKTSSNYFRKSIDSLIESQSIERIETKFAGKVPTYRWKIITKLLTKTL